MFEGICFMRAGGGGGRAGGGRAAGGPPPQIFWNGRSHSQKVHVSYGIERLRRH